MLKECIKNNLIEELLNQWLLYIISEFKIQHQKYSLFQFFLITFQRAAVKYPEHSESFHKDTSTMEKGYEGE